jgi:hypothetical protein
MQPYTYLIGWPELNTYYYGVRYSKKCNPSDFWVTYFTSSKKVKEFVIKHGEPTVIQVRKTFTDAQTARLWEERVLKKLKVSNNPKWLNTNHTMAPPIHSGDTHHNKHPEARARQRALMKTEFNPMKRPEVAIKITGSNNGAKQATAREKQRQNQLALGDNHHTKRPEERAKRSERLKKRWETFQFKKILCPHCEQLIGQNNYKRYHGNNCKSNLTSLVANTDR